MLFYITNFFKETGGKKDGGFTLIETIVTIFVFALAMGAVSGLIVMGYRTQSYTWQQSQAIKEARRGVEIMIKEIREARTGEDGSYTLYKTENKEFGFYSDIDKDLAIEKVRYFLEGSDFKKGVIEPVEILEPVEIPATYPGENEEISILSQYVRNQPPIFRYFDGARVELSPPARKADTKLMQVFLVINVDENRPPQNFELKSEVQIRNLKTNL